MVHMDVYLSSKRELKFNNDLPYFNTLITYMSFYQKRKTYFKVQHENSSISLSYLISALTSNNPRMFVTQPKTPISLIMSN